MENSDYKEKRKHEVRVRSLSWRDFRLAAAMLLVATVIVAVSIFPLSENPLIYALPTTSYLVPHIIFYILVPSTIAIFLRLYFSRLFSLKIRGIDRWIYLVSYAFVTALSLFILTFLLISWWLLRISSGVYESSLTFGEQTYHLVWKDANGGLAQNYYLIVCNKDGSECAEVVSAGRTYERANMLISDDNTSIIVLDAEGLIFTYTPEIAGTE